jgi:peptide methionine sulfoxide reductase msrA/msrB
MLKFAIILYATILIVSGCEGRSQTDTENKYNNSEQNMKYNKLTKEEERVLIYKETEIPYSGKYVNNHEEGVYTCKRCNAILFSSGDKFDSECGWPSFDDAFPGAVKEIPDADGIRTEILCANCGSHLGHVFRGEEFTNKDTRHCVNSISLNFVSKEHKNKSDTAIFASACFWRTEYYFQNAKGVQSTTVGYTGGSIDNPSYRDVCSGKTGHFESVLIEYIQNETNYDNMVKLFFETHDFTQLNGQGPDIGPQYRSAIFYKNDEQKIIAEKYIKLLNDKGYKVSTLLLPACKFWQAEDYHQDYYKNNGNRPYCHVYRQIF